MRFLIKRQPASELEQEIKDVRHVMGLCSLVLFDLLFYSFLFAILILPAKSGLFLFGVLYVFIYLSFTYLFLQLHKIMQ